MKGKKLGIISGEDDGLCYRSPGGCTSAPEVVLWDTIRRKEREDRIEGQVLDRES